MLNLGYELETTVAIDGIKYELDMSFDNILRLQDMFSDKEVPGAIKVVLALDMLIEKRLDMDIEKQSDVLKSIFENFIRGEKLDKPNYDIAGNIMPSTEGAKERVMSFKQDANYIYASFMQDYQIDLFEQQGRLDWRKFIALVDGLSKGTRLKEVIEIRTMDVPKGKKSGEQKKKVEDAKRKYALKKEDD